MKKFLFILMLLFTTTLSYSQTYYTDYMSKMIMVDSCWTDWSDWYQHFTEVEIYKDSIVVYDEDVYIIHKQLKDEIDETSVTSIYKATNKKGDCVQIRLRIQCDGIKQLYIDFKNKIWVYNLN